MFFSNNEYVADVSLLTLHGKNIEDYDKQDIVTNISFEAIVPSIKKYLFFHRMVDFVNKLGHLLLEVEEGRVGVIMSKIYNPN